MTSHNAAAVFKELQDKYVESERLAALPTAAHADAILTEFGIAAWVGSSTMEYIRNRLVEHLNVAEQRGSKIRDMETGDNECSGAIVRKRLLEHVDALILEQRRFMLK